MRTESRPDGGPRQSFIKQARRDQVVTAAIEVLAETGYANTSLAAIAQHAGISKSVISYHFSGKDELMETVVDVIYADVAAAVGPQLDDADSAADRVRAYVLSVARYARRHRSRLSALGEVTANLRTADGRLQYGMHTSELLFQVLEDIYAGGQRTGEFRAFDARVMAVTHQGAVETMLSYWGLHPELDLDAYADSLSDLLVHAARSDHA